MVRVRVRGVAVEEADDVGAGLAAARATSRRPCRAPVRTRASTSSWSITVAPAARPISAVPSAEAASTTSTLVDQAGVAQRADGAGEDAAERLGASLVGITTATDVAPLCRSRRCGGKSRGAYRRRAAHGETARSTDSPRAARPSVRADVRTRTSAAWRIGIPACVSRSAKAASSSAGTGSMPPTAR